MVFLTLGIQKEIHGAVKASVISKTQIGQGPVHLFQEGGMPFGLSDGLSLTIAYVPVEPQAILKLH